MTTTSKAKPKPGGWNQSRYPTWIAEAQILNPSHDAFQGVHSQEAGSEGEPGLRPGTLICDASILSGVLTTETNACPYIYRFLNKILTTVVV